jgi:signal peptidase I
MGAIWLTWRVRRLRRYEIAEHSMTPALVPGDFVIARSGGLPARGEVVIIGHPEKPGMEIVKRVIGLPGETVTVSGGLVHIDGARLPEPWADGPTCPEGTWRIPSDAMFVLGDNRRRSSGDSRTLGPIAVPDPLWTVQWRYWPARRIDIV